MTSNLAQIPDLDGVIPGRRPPTTLKLTKPSLIAYLKDLAVRRRRKTLTCRDVKEDGQISVPTIIRVFGSFSKAVVQAGCRPGRTYDRDRTTMLRCLAALRAKLKRRPSKTEVKKYLPYSPRSYIKEFGSMANALKKAAKYRAPASPVPPVGPPSPSISRSGIVHQQFDCLNRRLDDLDQKLEMIVGGYRASHNSRDNHNDGLFERINSVEKLLKKLAEHLGLTC